MAIGMMIAQRISGPQGGSNQSVEVTQIASFFNSTQHHAGKSSHVRIRSIAFVDISYVPERQ
jgi:hypothetical protein